MGNDVVTFDPINKLIIVLTGITYIDVGIDLYSNWKEWVLIDDNAKYDAAFFTFGGEPISEFQSTPPYYFLTNGWKVYVENMSITVDMNLYSDDGLSPFIINNASVTNNTSDVPIVRSDVEKRLAYGDRVYFDFNSPYVGIEHPVGTIAQPVNNIQQAIIIANTYNLNKIYIRSDLNITDDYNLSEFSIYGDKNEYIVTSNISSIILNNTYFYNVTIQGDFNGSKTSIIDSIIENDIYNINGNIKNTQLSSTIKIDNNLILSNCFTGNSNKELIIDTNNNKNTKTLIRSYSGEVKVINTNDNDVINIELIAGKIILDESCSGGTIDIRGVGYLENYASSGITLVLDGFIMDISNICHINFLIFIYILKYKTRFFYKLLYRFFSSCLNFPTLCWWFSFKSTPFFCW
ncbi:hypothetical protein [Trichloromonas sp.]|uniref:hypothetical protein n=1 Tax=Trichloromonas sp. TaxID=3069249 RepID=UPI002A445624|nr:hypothetical protein [Trichloromonas sp.]